jgi:hypothetical protein
VWYDFLVKITSNLAHFNGSRIESQKYLKLTYTYKTLYFTTRQLLRSINFSTLKHLFLTQFDVEKMIRKFDGKKWAISKLS